MVFNRIETLQHQQLEAGERFGPLRARLVKLLEEYGEKRKVPFLKLTQGGSSAFWELSVDGLRDGGSSQAARTTVKIMTDAQARKAHDPSQAHEIDVEVQSDDVQIRYHIHRFLEDSVSEIERNGEFVEEVGWESIAELDDAFFGWVEQALTHQRRLQLDRDTYR